MHVQNSEMVKVMNTTKQGQDDLLRAKEQLASELDLLRQGTRIKVGFQVKSLNIEYPQITLLMKNCWEMFLVWVKIFSYELSLDQTDQQHQEIDRLNKELMEQRAELAHLHNALGNKDMVRLNAEKSETLDSQSFPRINHVSSATWA